MSHIVGHINVNKLNKKQAVELGSFITDVHVEREREHQKWTALDVVRGVQAEIERPLQTHPVACGLLLTSCLLMFTLYFLNWHTSLKSVYIRVVKISSLDIRSRTRIWEWSLTLKSSSGALGQSPIRRPGDIVRKKLVSAANYTTVSSDRN